MVKRTPQTTRLAACSSQSQAAGADECFAACTFELQSDGAVQLLPAGQFRARDGRPTDAPYWLLDADIAADVIARARRRKTPLVIDYEHQTLLAEENGQPAPAAGWMRGEGMVFREGEGLFVSDIQWTEKAKGFIDAGEYRFISAVFRYIPETGVVTEILHAGITNYPALDGMSDLTGRAAARALGLSDQSEDETVKREELIKMLGLDAKATDAQIRESLAATKARADNAPPVSRKDLTASLGLKEDADDKAIKEALAATRTLDRNKVVESLGLDKEATDEQINEALAATKTGGGGSTYDPTKHVPVETVEALRTEVRELRERENGREVDELVKSGLDDGRLLPAQETWARDLGKKDVAALRSYLETSKPVAALRGQQTNGEPPKGEDGKIQLTESQVAICKSMNISEDEFRKQLEDEQSQKEA